ncbi:MAG: hypothetical protein EOO73_26765 [Myxococcales bacterium]|nr:MAG: hypothetical protein EOO73_26765 [Myxococcales bacterium]
MSLAASIVVLVIAGSADDSVAASVESAARAVLGEDGRVELIAVGSDPPDTESAERATAFDGVVELSWSADGSRARLHCYMARERRWVDRDISFGAPRGGSERDASERGRLLGFAAASMFVELVEPVTQPSPSSSPSVTAPSRGEPSPEKLPSFHGRAIELAGAAAVGIGGTASGLGATAGFRWQHAGPLWARLFVAGRTGTIPEAQATTRAAQLGAGLALSALDEASSAWVLGARVDAFAGFLEASHFSEDDVQPDARSRWLPGCDALLEAGVRLSQGTGIFAAAGAEIMFGRTDVYTHGNRVAVVAPLRAVGELGFRAGF